MIDDGEAIVHRVDDQFTEEALRENDGKVVPLTLEIGGPVVGQATLRYVEDERALVADFQVEDPKVAELLRGAPPNIFMQ
jgi:hypothetical protein